MGDAVLRLGAKGEAVERLQDALRAAGFAPGATDGVFGPGTEAALRGFQRGHGLLADGVAGPRSWAALRAAGQAPAPIAMVDDTPAMTVAVAARMLPGARPAAIARHLPPVLAALREAQLADRPMLLMALATIAAETAGFLPVDEGISRYNTSPGGHPFNLYDNRQDLGNRGAPDGALFKGRGFIQLTGRDNYASIGAALGLDLAGQPEQANDAVVAARILALFLKRREAPIRAALRQGDLRAARRLVNGGAHGLAAFTAAWRAGVALLPAPRPLGRVQSTGRKMKTTAATRQAMAAR